MDSPTPCEVAIVPSPSGRRTFLRWCTAICGAIAATFLSIPVVGYFFGLRKHSVDWVDLGHVNDFPLNQTRRIDFDNPLRQPWDGMTAITGVYVRYEGKNDEQEDQFLVLSINCATSAAPLAGFSNRACSCAPVTAAFTTRMAHMRPVRHRAVYITAYGVCRAAG